MQVHEFLVDSVVFVHIGVCKTVNVDELFLDG